MKQCPIRFVSVPINFETFLFIRKNGPFSPKNAKRGNTDFVKNRMKQRKAERWNRISLRITSTFEFNSQHILELSNRPKREVMSNQICGGAN